MNQQRQASIVFACTVLVAMVIVLCHQPVPVVCVAASGVAGVMVGALALLIKFQ